MAGEDVKASGGERKKKSSGRTRKNSRAEPPKDIEEETKETVSKKKESSSGDKKKDSSDLKKTSSRKREKKDASKPKRKREEKDSSKGESEQKSKSTKSKEPDAEEPKSGWKNASASKEKAKTKDTKPESKPTASPAPDDGPPKEAPRAPPPADDKNQVPEALLAAKANSNPGKMTMLPIQPQAPEPTKKKKGWGFFGRGKKEQTVQVGGIISVKREGHAGFDEGGELRTEGLPPQVADFFSKLDTLIRAQGKDGVTQEEMKYVLKKYGHIIIEVPKPGPTPTPTKVEPAPVVPDKLTYEELEQQFAEQTVQLSGLKNVLSTIQMAKTKFSEEVTQLHEVLDKERQEMKELREKNTNLEISLARAAASGSGDGKANDSALAKIESVLTTQINDLTLKLEGEQAKTKSLHAQITEMSDEREDLLAQIGQLEERLKLSAKALESSQHMPREDPGPPPTTPAPPPPNTPAPAPPPPPSGPAPPPPPVQNIANTGGGGMLSGIGSVALKKTEPAPKKSAGGTADLLADIRKGTNLKKVDPSTQDRAPPAETDDGNVLNLIAKALLDRRAGIKDDSEGEEKSDDGDWSE